jgi:hypothetical protein
MLNGPQKIILLRAGKYDYAEVELSGAVQIVGPNNTGKTTLINTLQFLYVDDLRTMDFGSYSLEQTLSYYFPSQYSYVLFECLGAAGQCVVGWRGQSKTSGGDPERFCFFGPYDPDDFFDEERRVREPRDVNVRLALKQFRVIKSAQEHRELLLPPAGADGKGIALVALRDADRFRRFRESLKDLLSLSTITQEQMRERLLTLADVRTDVPALDVRKLFGDDYDLIRSRRDAVARFRKHEGEVRRLVQSFGELDAVRGELIALWSDLRAKRAAFEQAHDERLTKFKQTIAAQENIRAEISAQLHDRGAERDACLSEKGGIESKLRELEGQAKAFAEFDPDLARAGEQNLKREELRLTKLLSDAETEPRQKAEQKVALYSELVRQKQQDIANFDRLAVTALRRHFKDEELAGAFRVLHFELLETPVGDDGITARDEAQLLQIVRDLAARVKNGAYEDEAVRIVLREGRRGLDELANVEALREKLREDNEVLCHWQGILNAILEREQLKTALKRCGLELEQLQKQLFAHEEFVKARAEEPRLKRDFKQVADTIARLSAAVTELESKRREAEREQEQARNAILAEENAYNEVMNRFGDCIFPEFDVKASTGDSLPADFDSAIALFLNRQERERRLAAEVTHRLQLVAQLVGEQFNGADDAETVRNLQGELEALPDKVEALERDWNALIQGLRGQFAGVLKELDAVRAAVTDLNRQFARIQVSDLKSIRLEVLEAGDLVSWIKRLVNLEQPGLFDDDTNVDQTIRNFRQKLEGSPLISFAQLFSLQFTVVGEDGASHHYQDFRQIESHGTTIAVKVLFNLLVLRRYLREDRCVVPFFLDEIQALDPANRAAVLSTARKLGFIAIAAAPEPVTEVDALYFLQPQQGRIVLRHRHRVGVNLKGDESNT